MEIVPFLFLVSISVWVLIFSVSPRRKGGQCFSFTLVFLSFTSPYSLLRKCQNPLPQCDSEPKQCPSCSGLHSSFGPQPDLHSPPFIPTEPGDANWAMRLYVS